MSDYLHPEAVERIARWTGATDPAVLDDIDAELDVAVNSGPGVTTQQLIRNLVADLGGAYVATELVKLSDVPLHEIKTEVDRLRARKLAQEAFAAENREGNGWARVDLAGLRGIPPVVPTMLRRSDGLCLLYAARTHSLSGESGSGKSWIAQWTVADVLIAGGFGLYLDFESEPTSVADRLRALGCSDEDLERLTYVNPAGPPTGPEFEALLSEAYTVAVIDGVTEAMAMSGLAGESLTNNNDAVTRWHAMFPKRLALETGAAVLQVDHVTKSKDGRGAYAIGAQAKRASITGAAYVVRPTAERFGRGRSGAIDLYLTKDRGGFVLGALTAPEGETGTYVGRVSVESDPESDAVRMALHAPRAEEDRHAEAMEAVAAFLATLPPEHPGASARMVRAEVTGANVLIDAALTALVSGGWVDKQVKGQASLHRLVHPYAPDFEVGEL